VQETVDAITKLSAAKRQAGNTWLRQPRKSDRARLRPCHISTPTLAPGGLR